MIVRSIQKAYASDYIRLRNDAQYPVFLAVVLGVKDSFDEWIPTDKYDEFVNMCNKYGLHVEPDVIFTTPPDSSDKEGVIGGQNITTTYKVAEPFDKKKEGDVHVLVARTKEKALEAKKAGWYPVVINGRLINKPFVDHLRFGRALGFPDCCVKFFGKYNNWKFYSHPYESFKNTTSPSYYCNNFLMDHSYSFIHHIPCSYDCKKTIEVARETEKKIAEVDPDFVEEAKRLLKKPLLVFDERNFVIFDGKLENNVLTYSQCQYFENLAKPEDRIDFLDDIKRANKIKIGENKLTIMSNGSVVREVEKKKEWFAIGFQ